MSQNRKYPRHIGMVAARLEHFQRIASYGLQRVELVILHREEHDGIRNLLDRTGMTLGVHCPLFRDCGLEDYPLLASVFDTDPERQRRYLQLVEQELGQASEWGATHLVVHLQRSVGIISEAVPPGWDEKRALDAAIEAGERLAAAAARTGIPVYVENMMSHPLLALPEHYAAFFDALPPSDISMCFDIGHAALDAVKYGFDLLEFASLMAPHIGSLHLYNNRIAADFDFATLRQQKQLRKYPVHPDHAPEEGWIDVLGVVDAVLSRNPAALVTFEVYFDLDAARDQTRVGLDWIAEACGRWRRDDWRTLRPLIDSCR